MSTQTTRDRIQAIRQRVLRRRRGLGGVLVEAGVMLPILASFYGFMHYNYTAFDTRIQLDAATRDAVTDAASHNCEPGYGNVSLAEFGLGVLNQATTDAASKHGEQGAVQVLGKLSQSAMFTLSSVTNGEVGSVRGWSLPIRSEIKMSCNEKAFDGNIGTWFKHAAGAFSGLGGGSFP